MNYELDKYKLFEKACNYVLDKTEIEPSAVFIDTIKYIDGYLNLKIKVYVVLDSDNEINFDEEINFEESKVHIKTLTMNQLLNVKRYKVAMLIANLTNSVAVINNKDISDFFISVMNGITPLDVLEILQYKVNSTVKVLASEKEFTLYNKNLVARTIKYIHLFTNIYENYDVLNGYNKTVEFLKHSDIILHLMNNTPMLELVAPEELEKTAQRNRFEDLKKQISSNVEVINKTMETLNEMIKKS